MNIWQNAVLTNKWLALQAKLIAGTTLNITRAVTGSGYVTPGLLQQQTAVTGIKQTLNFRPITYPESGKCCVPAYLTNDGLATGYTAMQVGLYATDPDEGEILYFIAQAASGTGTVIPSATEMPGFNAEWNLYFQYGQADTVNVTVDPSNTVSLAEFEAHTEDTSNPHSVTKAQVGLENVPNVTTNNQAPTYSEAASLATLTSGETLATAFGKIKKAIASLISHLSNTSNPHGVTAAQANALPISGGTLTGNLTIDPSYSSPPAFTLTAEAPTNTTASMRMSKNANNASDLGTYIRDYNAGGVESNNYTQLQIRRGSPSLATRIQLIDVVNGVTTAYNIYGDFNKQVVNATTEAD